MEGDNLPNELLREYEKAIDEFDDSESIFRILHLKTKCVRIAVEYCNSQSPKMINALRVQKVIVESQMEKSEELMAALVMVKEHFWPVIDSASERWQEITLEKIDELIIKYNGKTKETNEDKIPD